MVTPAFSIVRIAPGSRLSQVSYPGFSSPPPGLPSVWPAPSRLRVPTVIGLTVSSWQSRDVGGGPRAVVGQVGQVAAEQVGDVAGDVFPLGVGVGVARALDGLGGLGERHLRPAGDVEQAGVAGVLGLAEERARRPGRGW